MSSNNLPNFRQVNFPTVLTDCIRSQFEIFIPYAAVGTPSAPYKAAGGATGVDLVPNAVAAVFLDVIEQCAWYSTDHADPECKTETDATVANVIREMNAQLDEPEGITDEEFTEICGHSEVYAMMFAEPACEHNHPWYVEHSRRIQERPGSRGAISEPLRRIWKPGWQRIY